MWVCERLLVCKNKTMVGECDSEGTHVCSSVCVCLCVCVERVNIREILVSKKWDVRLYVC